MAKRERASEMEYLVAWLDDYGPYEVCMMRYALIRMHSARDQLDYNAHFECFASKARSLVDFLTSRHRKESKNTTFDAKHFAPDFVAPRREGVQSIINAVEPHALHAGKYRALTRLEKITLNDSIKLAGWIEKALQMFLDALPSHSKARWNNQKAKAGGSIARIVTKVA